jgi:hypothetical protein
MPSQTKAEFIWPARCIEPAQGTAKHSSVRLDKVSSGGLKLMRHRMNNHCSNVLNLKRLFSTGNRWMVLRFKLWAVWEESLKPLALPGSRP